MPITINGSTGISGVDGSAGTPALIGSDADTGIFLAAGQVSASVNGTAGNVPLVSGTAQASTSGTNIDFTGIPSWVKRVTVMLSGVSTSGTSVVQVQLGTSTGFETSGYTSTAGGMNSTGIASAVYFTSGCGLRGTNTAAFVYTGNIVFSLLSSNTFTHMGQFICDASASGSIVMGGKALSGTLDRIRITTANGTDTFDAGSINIMYE